MTPQSGFMFLAPIAEGQEEALHALLATMRGPTALADPDNALVPFGRFGRLHFARFVILKSAVAEDIGVYGHPAAGWRPSLAFLGDCDGPAEALVAELVEGAGAGLRRIFAHCDGFDPGGDLAGWLARHAISPAAGYVNWIGRTVARIREEEALATILVRHLQDIAAQGAAPPPAELQARLLAFVGAERQAGRLTLTPEEPTPSGWALRNLLHLVGVPAALLVLAPFLLVASPLLVLRLRSLETSDPEIVPRADPAHVRLLAADEDFDVTNQFSAFGDVKPGRFRRGAVVLLLALLDYACRHVYRRGHLTRVQTIHFARWVLLGDRKHVFFASNYDGSLESYMDDFINKVAWGINAVFGNGVGFPRVRWLLRGGAEFEQKYKNFLRRHQVPTAVWYKAYPGLSVADLNRHTRIREGIDRPAGTEREVREWLGLLSAGGVT